ncbi:MAG: 3-dehydroquinate synthase II, partial [Halobacteriota archaeon]
MLSYFAKDNNRASHLLLLPYTDTRVVTVGRNKIERRPLLLIKGKIGDVEINTILQDDWHVRVMGADGDAKNITQLKKGDRLMGC